APSAVVARVASECGLAAVQLHGDELSENYRGTAVPVWRAVRLAGRVARPDPRRWPAQRYVVDAAAPGRYGGTGLTVDWTVAGALARQQPVMLAGGLTPDNVAAAVRRARPLGVDVAGGVELRPGRKDRHKMREFVRAARRSMI
ncbi:MAG: phosphoribosylanthranilate isomerase, partial [Lentisphaerae bacterium]|nr:phosphoribosylanthranilate isomerase [Lentisphaerota bacterium]